MLFIINASFLQIGIQPEKIIPQKDKASKEECITHINEHRRAVLHSGLRKEDGQEYDARKMEPNDAGRT
jgi:hypothetical protein